MSYTPRIPAIEVTGAYGSILKVVSRKLLGKVPNSAGVMWHYPAILKDLMGFNGKAEKWHELDENLSILARMAAAAAVGCSACLDINYFMAHRKGLDEAKVREVPRWRESIGVHAPGAAGDGVRLRDVRDPRRRDRRAV